MISLETETISIVCFLYVKTKETLTLLLLFKSVVIYLSNPIALIDINNIICPKLIGSQPVPKIGFSKGASSEGNRIHCVR